MPLLFYWQRDNYLRDRSHGFGFHLNQSRPAMAHVQPGESIWAFTQRRRDRAYVLAAELIVKAVTRNPPRYHYGMHRAWGASGARGTSTPTLGLTWNLLSGR